MLTQLQQLGELKASGVLTEEEFAAQKAKILAG
jgi:Short C-terminal domain